MFLKVTNRKAWDWIKAIVLAALAYILFYLPNSGEVAGFVGIFFFGYLFSFGDLVQIGAILSAVVAFLSALWE